MSSERVPFIEFGKIAEFRNGLNFSKDSHGAGCWLIGVADFQNNFTPDYDSLQEVNPEGITKDEDYLKKGDILFVRSNGNKSLVGRSLFIERDVNALFSGFCIRARLVNDLIDPLFLAYYTRTDHFKSSISSVAGTNINNLTQDILSNVRLPQYPKAVQFSIANVLSSIDGKIELNKRINVELTAMARTLYDYWFVQFDFPDAKGQPYKASGGKLEWNSKLNRKIPENWDVYRLDDILQCNYDSIGQNEEREYINYLDTSNLTNNVVEAVQYIGKCEIRPSRAQRIINKDDVLYSTVRPSQRHFGIIKHPLKNFVASTGFAQLTSKRQAIKNELIYLYLTSSSVINHLQKIADGSVSSYPSISTDVLMDLNITLPRDEGLLNIAGSRFATWFEMQSINQQENKKLAELRDWLLPLLLNGQVRALNPPNLGKFTR